jgi:hypothetical protein
VYNILELFGKCVCPDLTTADNQKIITKVMARIKEQND